MINSWVSRVPCELNEWVRKPVNSSNNSSNNVSLGRSSWSIKPPGEQRIPRWPMSMCSLWSKQNQLDDSRVNGTLLYPLCRSFLLLHFFNQQQHQQLRLLHPSIHPLSSLCILLSSLFSLSHSHFLTSLHLFSCIVSNSRLTHSKQLNHLLKLRFTLLPIIITSDLLSFISIIIISESNWNASAKCVTTTLRHRSRYSEDEISRE